MLKKVSLLLGVIAGLAATAQAQSSCTVTSVVFTSPALTVNLAAGELSRGSQLSTSVSGSLCNPGEITVSYFLDGQLIDSSSDEGTNYSVGIALSPGTYTYTAVAQGPNDSAQDTLTVTVTSDDDTDGNGIPDDPFTTLATDLDQWSARVPGAIGERAVVARRVERSCSKEEKGGPSISVESPSNPLQTISVTFTTSTFLECGESGIVLIIAADNPEDLVDESPSALLAGFPTGDIVPGGSLFSVSLLVSTDGGATYTQRRSLSAPVEIGIDELSPGSGPAFERSFLRHNIGVAPNGGGLLRVSGVIDNWENNGIFMTQTGAQFRGATSELSAFVPIERPGDADLSFSPGSIDFGDVTLNQSFSQGISLTNVGGTPVTGTASLVVGGGSGLAVAGSVAYSIGAGQSTSIIAVFNPQAAGVVSDSIRLTGDDDGDLFIPLSANVLPDAEGEGDGTIEGAPEGTAEGTSEGEGEGLPVLDARLIAQVRNTAGGVLRNSVIRIAPINSIIGFPAEDQLDWIVRSRKTDAPFDVPLPGSPFYRVAATAPGSDTDRQTLQIDGEVTVDVQLSANPAIVDTDGDGIIDIDEINVFKINRESVDTDLDGMGDLFELEADFPAANKFPDPIVGSSGDADFDLLSNIEEQIAGSNPRDASSPSTTFFVQAGAASGGDGSRAKPFGTIQDAFSALGTAKEAFPMVVKGDKVIVAPASVILRNGTYVGDVTLRENTRLVGESRAGVTIVGRVASAPGASLANLTLQEPASPPAGADALFVVDDPNIAISNVRFVGDSDKQGSAVGVLLQGDQQGTVLTDCVFNSLRIGGEVQGTLPVFRRSIISGISEIGLLISGAPTEPLGPNKIGDATDPQSGWNQFTDIGETSFVNERQEQVKVENCYWGTDDVESVTGLVEGPTDFTPILRISSGILPGSLTCIVTNAADRTPILDATVTLLPAAFPPVSDNVDGVYAFAAIPAENYDVEVAAEGFLPQVASVNIAGGGGANLLFALDAGTVPPPNSGCQCNQKAGEEAPAETVAGNSLLAALTVFGLLAGARRRRNG